MNIDEIKQLMKEIGQPSYRAGQIFEWLHKRLPKVAAEAFLNADASFTDFTFAAMNNLPKALRDKLAELCYISQVSIKEKLAADDGTVKYLLQLGSDNQVAGGDVGVYIESVLMHYAHGRSICISTQAGCRMGCIFCATGQGGFIRNLSAAEMCMQVYAAGGARNVVLMGCGEPLDNYDAVLRFIRLITHPKGAGLSQRHITLSTCGLVPQILALAQEKLQITLAVSLHGPDDATRQVFMPIAKAYPIKDLIDACRKYTDITRRRISFEYALTTGINDSPAHARDLARLLRGMLCHVNLIPVNSIAVDSKASEPRTNTRAGGAQVGEFRGAFRPSSKNTAQAFQDVLQQANIPATIRRTIGAQVNAACGQLRANSVK